MDRQGSPSTTIYDKTWNVPPPWAGPLHLTEERVVPKSQPTSLCLLRALPWEKKERINVWEAAWVTVGFPPKKAQGGARDSSEYDFTTGPWPPWRDSAYRLPERALQPQALGASRGRQPEGSLWSRGLSRGNRCLQAPPSEAPGAEKAEARPLGGAARSDREIPHGC